MFVDRRKVGGGGLLYVPSIFDLIEHFGGDVSACSRAQADP
jgi:hypothetical protein